MSCRGDIICNYNIWSAIRGVYPRTPDMKQGLIDITARIPRIVLRGEEDGLGRHALCLRWGAHAKRHEQFTWSLRAPGNLWHLFLFYGWRFLFTFINNKCFKYFVFIILLLSYSQIDRMVELSILLNKPVNTSYECPLLSLNRYLVIITVSVQHFSN